MFHIVDDIKELRDVLQDLVQSAGYRTMQFDSAESYLDYFNSEEFIAPIAILTDYEMPGLTGLEMIKKVHAKLPLQKAVIISGTPNIKLDTEIHTDICYLLAKPYHADKLFSLLEALNQCEQSCPSGSFEFQKTCAHGLQDNCPFHSKNTPAQHL